MLPEQALHLSPFVECGLSSWTFGYRDLSRDIVVASVEVPSELIEQAVFANVSVEIELLGDGEVVSVANGAVSAWSCAKKIVPVDALVESFLSKSNLHMEEVTEIELKGLLERLQKSVQAVQRAIALFEEKWIRVQGPFSEE